MKMDQQRKISVLGLGYVGLPMAVAFGQKMPVLAFDTDDARLLALKNGNDFTGEVSQSDLQSAQLHFVNNASDLAAADFHIVTVPTPVDANRQPDLSAIKIASEMLGGILKKGDIVVYESTVYPGVVEDICAPILAQHSGLTSGEDFFLGYSPERINPGDREHTFTKIKKVVSAQTPECLDIVAAVYESVVDAGIYRATSIKVAEAAKVIENTQRDLNIALINELAMLFNRLGINTQAVIETAKTKWNFLPFEPGLVGGHCIGVDPYYLTYKAHEVDFHPEVISAGRRVNDGMGRYIALQTIKLMLQSGKRLQRQRIALLGVTFKENCPDIRNSKAMDIYRELHEDGFEVLLHDPLADAYSVQETYGVSLTLWEDIEDVSAIIVAVPHAAYREIPDYDFIQRLSNSKIFVDVKGRWSPQAFEEHGVTVWQL